MFSLGGPGFGIRQFDVEYYTMYLYRSATEGLYKTKGESRPFGPRLRTDGSGESIETCLPCSTGRSRNRFLRSLRRATTGGSRGGEASTW